MGPEELVRACLGEIREQDGFDPASDVAETHRVALLGTVGVAAVLIGFALGVHHSERDDALELLEALIHAAQQDEDGGGRIGGRFLAEAERAMGVPSISDLFDPPVTHDLARAYARAGVPLPPELMQRLIGQMEELTAAGRLPVDADTEIERLSVLLDLEEDYMEHYLHGELDERVGTLPDEIRAAFAYDVACREEAVCGRIAMYWLLNDAAAVRLGAAEGFRERARREIVEPVSAALVPLIRNWMPADAGRVLVDEALAEARRRELVAPLPGPRRHRAEIYGSLPDKWGTQMLHVVLRGGDQPALATVITELGRGIAEAVVVPGMEAITEFMETNTFDAMIEIPWETFEEQVAVALAEGLALERPPPAGLIDVALSCGMRELRPQAMSAGEWLSDLDPDDGIAALPQPVREELVGGSAAWPDDYRVVKGWSAGTAVLQQAMDESDEADRLRARFFARLEPLRGDWALRMLRSAHVLKGAGNVDWKTYAATAKALLDGQALETIPIMEYVWQRTNRELVNEELQGGQG